MSSRFEDYGLTAADIQARTSLTLNTIIFRVLCHGIYTCIFFIALHYISQSTQSIQKRITLVGITAFLWSANTVMVALEWKYANNILITHGTSLEDEFNGYLETDLPLSLTVSIFRALSTIVADSVLIWRCWVLYGGNLVVIAAPSLCLIAETLSVCFAMVSMYANNFTTNSAQANWSLLYYTMTVVTNSLCSFLILFRVVRISDLGASLKTYRGIIEIVVESAAMYAIVYIALLACYAFEFYTNQTVMGATSFLMMVSYSITGIAPTLIIARVMAGHSRPDDSWTRPSLANLRSPTRSLAGSLRFARAHNQSNGTGRTTTDIDLEQAQEPQVAEGEGEEAGDVRPEIEASEYGKRAECNLSVEKV